MTKRSFEVQARLQASDGKWPRVPGTFHFAASSLDEFSTELSAALVAGHVPVGSAVRVVQVFNADEEEWEPIVSLDDIPDISKLRLETAPAQPLPHDVAYDDAKFTVGEPGAASPIAQDATGAVVAIDAGSLSFQLQHYAALEWLTVDEHTGELKGTPTQPCKVVDAEVLVTFPAGKFRVCRVTIQAEAPIDSRHALFF